MGIERKRVVEMGPIAKRLVRIDGPIGDAMAGFLDHMLDTKVAQDWLMIDQNIRNLPPQDQEIVYAGTDEFTRAYFGW